MKRIVYTARDARHEVCSRLMASSASFTKTAQSSSVQSVPSIFVSMTLNSLLATA